MGDLRNKLKKIDDYFEGLSIDEFDNLLERNGIMDNKFEFMSEIADAFAGLKSEKEIEVRAEEMIKLILQQKELSKGYLKVGIL